MNNWEEQYDNLFGEEHHKVCIGKKCQCHIEVKQFIKDIRKKDRQEMLNITAWNDFNERVDLINKYYE